MKSKFFSIIIILMIMTLILTSCNSNIEKIDEKQQKINKILNANDSDSIDAIQVWCYLYADDSRYKEIIYNITTKIRAYCKANKIPIKIVKYDEKKISYDDYVLKRNTAMATANVIVIDDARKLAEISNQCYDYSKINGYENLFDMYKDRYCIPLGIGYVTRYVSGEFFDYYNLKPSRDVITYSEYLNLKYESKELGAKFSINKTEWEEITDYNIMKNDLYMLGDKSDILKDDKKLKAAIKKSIIGIYDDYKRHYAAHSSIKELEKNSSSDVLYDSKSRINLMSGSSRDRYLTEYWSYSPGGDNRIFVLMPNNTKISPCIYLNKNINDERVLDIVSKIMQISYYKTFVFDYQDGYVQPAPWYSPTSNTSDMRRYAEVDSTWKYNGMLTKNTVYSAMIHRVNQAYEVLLKNGEESIKNADYYFSNDAYNKAIKSSIQSLAKKLISEKLDYNNKQVDNFLNEEINELVMNFYVHFN